MLLPTLSNSVNMATYFNEKSILSFWIMLKMYSMFVMALAVPYLICYMVWCLYLNYNWPIPFFSAISSMLLLHSYIEKIPDRFPQLEVLIPLKTTEDGDDSKRTEKTKCCVLFFQKISNAYNYIVRSILFSDEALNYGCDQFLNEAREILKAKRLAKVKARKKAEARRKENELLRSLIHEGLQKTNLLDDMKETISDDRKMI